MCAKNKFLHPIFTLQQVFDKSYESFCFQNCLKFILEAMGVGNAPFYMNASMSLVLEEKDSRLHIGMDDNIRCLLPSMDEMVNRYYYKDFEAAEVFDINVKYMTDKNEPIIVGVDTFYLPYAANYQKNHAIHTAILCGYNLLKKEVYVIDWYAPWLFKGKVSLSDFLNARSSDNPYDGTIFSGKPIHNNWAGLNYVERYDSEKLFGEVIELSRKQYFQEGTQRKQGVRALIEVQNYIRECTDPKEYFRIYQRLYIVFKRHKFFLGYLQEYVKYTENIFANNVIAQLIPIVEKWDAALMLLLKLKIDNSIRTKDRLLRVYNDNIKKEEILAEIVLKN